MKYENKDIFNILKDSILNIDPVAFCEKYLTLDGEPFRLTNNGYKPFADIYRYIGIKALERDAKPVILLKGRQIGATTMASALEMYFMGCGRFGTLERPPMRLIHVWPTLDFCFAYSKTKLNSMINQSIKVDSDDGKTKSYMQSLIDKTASVNDSSQFKQFINGNHMWIESAGIDGDRLRGKQLCLETDIPTPHGFIKLKDLKEGDELFDEQGNVCKVTKLHPINNSPEAYRITFDDGSIVDACADHLWLTYTINDRRRIENNKNCTPKIKNTKEILNSFKVKHGNKMVSNHSIPCTKPVNYEKKYLKLDPYLLGVWLGDGKSSRGEIVCTNKDIEIIDNIKKAGFEVVRSVKPNNKTENFENKCFKYRIGALIKTSKGKTSKLYALLKQYNLINNKHIPNDYLYSSIEDRLSLLQGLMDTDGSVRKNGQARFCTTIDVLASQAHQLAESLGIKCSINKYKNIDKNNKRHKDYYELTFMTDLPVFRLSRKLLLLKNKIKLNSKHRYISKIERIESKPMRCITVDSPSHLFLITKNFIPTHNTADCMFFDEVQDIPGIAIGNSLKVLTTAKYGKLNGGIQVFFGTPKQRGSDYYQMWQASSQQYYYLGCEKCEKHFPLYTPGSDEWENIWIHTYIVRCTHCGHEQDKRQAAERGKWVATKDPATSKYVGFHINQLYIPSFTKENIIAEKPANHPINTERVYQNEVLGEFYQGETGVMSAEKIRELCGDVGRKFRASISPDEGKLVFLGLDIGSKSDLAQHVDKKSVAQQGQSYSTAVILTLSGAGILSIDRALKFRKNDLESKKGIVEQMMKQYSVNLAVCDIGYANDYCEIMQQEFGDRFLASRVVGKINDHVKYNDKVFPKEIDFEKDHYISEVYDQMKKGHIRFPLGDYEQVNWLIQHCSSMEIKASISRTGDINPHYVKGSTPNDGFMALINAYLAYKFYISNGFTIKNPLLFKKGITGSGGKVMPDGPPIIGARIPRMK